MKKITPILIPSLLIAFLLISFTSCKKDKDKSSINAASLTKYQLLIMMKSPTKADTRVVLFSNTDNKTIAQLVGVDSDHAQTVTLSNNTITLQETGGDKASFAFSLKEDNNGEIVITDVKYTNTADPNMKVQAYYINKTAEMYPIKGSHYDGGAAGLLIFDANTWRYSGSTLTGTYSQVAPGTWKGTAGGKLYMGVSFKENNRPYIVLQTAKERYAVYFLV